MTDYVAIMNRIHEMIYNSTNDKRVLEYIAQELQNEGIGWIPVNERLPKEGQLVQIGNKKDAVGYYVWDNDGTYEHTMPDYPAWCISDEQSELFIPYDEYVEYWHPLALAPPKE